MTDDFYDSSDSVRHKRALKHAKTFQLAEPFRLERGGELEEVQVVYETYGTLSSAKDNAVLICHALSGDSHVAAHDESDDPGWWGIAVGPGKLMEKTGERYYEAELYRLKGELMLTRGGDGAEAEACFHRAIDVARRQQAKSWELRATVSLSRLWQNQGKVEEARQMLQEIYDWFTEGFDTKDLQEARTLLEELSSG